MSTKKMARFVHLFTILMLAWSANSGAYAAPLAWANRRAGNTYYVSTSGKDSNPGTLSQPWRTIGEASNSVAAGDTVYIRGGIYQEIVTLGRSGTAALPIKFLAYSGETPIIDGDNYRLPNYDWGTLLRISGSYVQVSGLEVRYSNWMGVTLVGQHVTVSDLNVHHIRETGILASGDYGLVENCRVWQSANRNESNSPYPGGGWATGLSAARSPNYVTLRGNTVYNNWGEGLSTFEANQITMEDNVVYDNWSANVYISDATNVLFQRNLVYLSPDSVIKTGLRGGILLGDEVYDPPSSDITIINNLVYGTRRNLFWYQGAQDGGMKNVLVANNTFANSTLETGIMISPGPHQNVRIENNLIQQDGTLPVAIVNSTTGLTFSTNLWSKTPPSGIASATDVVGDPNLAETGQTGAGLLTAEWFRLLAASPARNTAKTISEVTCDYFGKWRGVPADIGAIEYDTVVPLTVPFYSTGRYDGWILESAENSSRGGTFRANTATFQLGDDALKRQYRAILSFDTTSLPANATILSAKLRIKPSSSSVGGNPFTVMGSLLVDIRKGAFGKIALQAADFQTSATAKRVGTFGKIPVGGWYVATLTTAGKNNINKSGVTQFRLYFSKGDNNNAKADYKKFFSGNATTRKPQLIITYSAP